MSPCTALGFPVLLTLGCGLALGCGGGTDSGDPGDTTGTGNDSGTFTGDGGSTTTSDGGSGTSDGGTGETCEQLTIGSGFTAPEVLIVLDQSTSMNEDGRWDAAVQAVSSVVQSLDASVAFGLAAFGTSSRRACSAVDVVINPALGNGPAISMYVNGASPRGGTPIAPMLELISSLKSDDAQAGDANQGNSLLGLSSVILMTDGAPNCNSRLDASNCTCTHPNPSSCAQNEAAGDSTLCLDDAASVAAVTALREQGVETHVIGYSVSQWEQTLNQMAAAGSTGGTYFPVENALELETSLGGIASGISTCSFTLEQEPADITYVRVTLNGAEIAHQSQASGGGGWDLRGNVVELIGSDCETAKSTPDAVLDIEVECEQVFVLR